MMFNRACKKCVLNNDCSFQDNNSVEDCEDVLVLEKEEFEREELEKDVYGNTDQYG